MRKINRASTGRSSSREALQCAAVGPERRRRIRLATLFGASALSTLAGVAYAADIDPVAASAAASLQANSVAVAAVGEVVVTARHRTEDAQKVPAALSVLGGALLAKTNTTNIAQVSQLVPSIQFTFFNARNANINIRGLGNNVGLANDGLDPGVGFYVDQVYYSRPATATLDLVDIDQIEVLRGPQGTLFGKNTTAGAINITTASPSAKPSAVAEITGGNWGYFQAKGSISGPILGDVLSGRISAATTTRAGLLTNVYNNNKVNDYRNLTVRGQLLYKPTDDLKFRLIADYGKQFTNCCDEVLAGVVASPIAGKDFLSFAHYFGYTPVVDPFARKADTNSQIQAKQETGGISLQADWSLPKAVLTSVTAWRFWNWWPANDSDYTPLSVMVRAQNGDYQNQLSQEFRIASAGTNLIDYVGGLYFFREQIAAVGAQQYGNAGSYFLLSSAVPAAVADGYALDYHSSYNTTSYAAFGQATWHVTDKWNLTGGLRYTYDDKSGRFIQVASGGVPLTGPLAPYASLRAKLGASTAFAIKNTKGDLSGQANVSYQVTPNILAYANYARGYKSGGLNLTQLPPGASPVIKPESIDSAEAGLKTRLFDRRLTVNGDIFWERDENYQANVFDPVLIKMYLSNVPEVRSQGAEVDVQAQPTDNLSLYGSVTFEDATYAKYPAAPCGLEHANLSFCNLSGRQLAGTPRWAASLGGEYSHPLPLGAQETEAYLGVDYTYRSGVNSSATDSVYTALAQISLVNARLGVRARDQRWDAYVWSKNLGAAKYFTFVSPGVGNTGALYAQLGDPQTYGVTLRVKY
jgi:iron complex outermembrane receptor protein